MEASTRIHFENQTIHTIFHDFRQCTFIAGDNGFAVFHSFNSHETKGFPSRGHDDSITGNIVTSEFFMWHPAKKSNSISIFLFDFYSATNYIVANNSEMEIISLTSIKGIQENIQPFLRIKPAYK